MTDQILVTLDINALINTYNKEEFMRKVFVEAISKNTEMIAQHIRDYAIKEIMTTDLNDKIKAKVEKRMQEFTLGSGDKYGQDFGFRAQLTEMVKGAVKDKEGAIKMKVSSAIEQKMTKEAIAAHVQHLVAERVMKALGDVCEGCDRDYY